GGRADESGVCGREGSAYCGDTWEHDGSRWIRRDPPTSPTPRADHAMVYDAARGRVILQGGVVDMDQDCVPLDGNRCGDTWAWDGSTWEQLTPDVRPPGRMLHAMAYDPARAQVVLFGGCDETGGGCAFGSAQRADTWVFDGSTWTEMAPPTSPPRRVRHAMAYDPVRGEVVLFGGTNAGNGGCGAGDVEQCSDTWAWDGSTWTERTPASAPAERENPAMAWDGARGAVVMTGGRRAPGKKCNGSNERECDDLWVWDGSTWTEDVRPEVPPRRAEAQLVFDPERGRLLLFGGRGSLGGPCADVGGTSCEGLWADAGGVWTELRALSEQPPARTAAPIAYDAARGRGVLFGGYGVPIGRCGVLGSGYCNDTWEWTPAGWLQRTPASSPPARSGLASAWDAQREVTVVFGGYADEMADCPPFDARVCADTWTWDGTSWTEHVVDPSPPARRAAAFAHDPVRGQTVLFGGTSASNARCDGANEDCGDTWTWDGAAWTKQTPSGAPGRRDRSAMAFDAAHGVMVLFGGEVASRGGCGIVDSRSCGDTWVWDGSGWTEQHPLVSPPARAGHGLAYDEVRGTVLLFGGEVEEVGACGDPSGTRCNDLWSWDGVTWTALGAQPSPPARQEVGLIHDPVLDVLLASGGYGERDGACGNDTRPECRDTWLWKGRSSPTAAMVLEVPWDAARVPEARIRAVGATWRAGGEGHPGGVTRPGAELVVWDGGAWVAVDAHAAPPSSPEDLCWTALVDASVPEGAGCATEVDPVRPGRVLGFSAQGAAAFAVRPAAPAGLQEGALVSEDVEVRVRYRLDP
ncbi:MAG: hypothetical protein H6732_19650, partial [Alphaproteobacteria bacterium]|nr:hypothetical protein [Alphaproteobacteria bacterium]